MAGTNQYLPIATAAGAVTLSYQQWLSYAARQQGFQIGELDPDVFNTMMRQHSVAGAALAQIICDYAGIDAVDDGSVPNFEANLRTAIAAMLAPAFEAQDASQAANTILAALSPAPPNINGFYRITVRIANTNTGPVQFNLNGLGLRPVFRRDGTALQAGDIRQGQYTELVNDGAEWFLAGAARSEIAAMIAAGSGMGAGATSPTRILYLTANQTLTVQTGETRARVLGFAGGGGGGGSYSNPSGGAGGGGGGSFDAYVTGLVAGQSIPCTVGSGGTAGAVSSSAYAGTGGNTSFGSYATATGGTGGQASASLTTPYVGLGGSATLASGVSGSVFTGGYAGAAYPTTIYGQTQPISGYGGGCTMGGMASPYGTNSVATNASLSYFPGGGGGGGINQGQGAPGAPGLLVLAFYP